jgi:peptidoglycan/LPS O-acetylase OafA/YrhL
MRRLRRLTEACPVLEIAAAMAILRTYRRLTIAVSAAASLCTGQALADDLAMAPGRAAGSTAMAAAPLAPGKAAGVHQAQGVGQSEFLIAGLGVLVIGGAVLVLAGGGGNGDQNAPRNFSMTTTTGTSP